MPDSYFDPAVDTVFQDLGKEANHKEQVSSSLILSDEVDLAAIVDDRPPPESIKDDPDPGFVGQWYGFAYHGPTIESHTNGMMGVMIEVLYEDGRFTANGSDGRGTFIVEGTLMSNQLLFTKKYQDNPDDDPIQRKYEGTLHDDLEKITGRWQKLPSSSSNEYEGIFTLYKKPKAFVRNRPPDHEFEENKIHALWKFACNAIKADVARHFISWGRLKERRDQRRCYIELYNQYKATGLEEQDATELRNLGSTLPREDIRYYRALAKKIRGREILHK